MSTMTILKIDQDNRTVLINWGWTVLNHDLPLEIVENPNMPQAEMLDVLALLRPSIPVDYKIPDSVLSLLSPSQAGMDFIEFIDGELTL